MKKQTNNKTTTVTTVVGTFLIKLSENDPLKWSLKQKLSFNVGLWYMLCPSILLTLAVHVY